MNNTIYFCSPASLRNLTSNLTYDCETHDKVIASLLLLYILIGLPWNVLVLLVILKEKLYQQPSIVLLLTLSVTDILILTSTLPIIITGFVGEYLFGSTDNVRCVTYHLFGTVSDTLEYCSTLTIVFMSLDGFLYVYKPLQYERLATPRKMLIIVIFIVIVCIFIALLLYFSPTELTFVSPLQACIPKFPEYVIGIFLILDIVVVIVIVACDVLFSCIALNNIRKVYGNTNSTDANMKSQLCCFKSCVTATSNPKQSRINRVFCGFVLPSSILVPFYTISYWILDCIEFDDNYFCVSKSLYIFLICPTIIHPILETWLIPDVRNALKEMVTRRLKSYVW